MTSPAIVKHKAIAQTKLVYAVTQLQTPEQPRACGAARQKNYLRIYGSESTWKTTLSSRPPSRKHTYLLIDPRSQITVTKNTTHRRGSPDADRNKFPTPQYHLTRHCFHWKLVSSLTKTKDSSRMSSCDIPDTIALPQS